MICKIERDGGTRFQVYARRNGKQVYVSTHDSRKEAECAESRFKVTTDMIATGELPAEVDESRTVDAGLDAWLEAIKLRGSRSHQSYSWFVTLIRPTIGGVAIARVTKQHVVRWRDDLALRYSANGLGNILAIGRSPG